MAYRWRKKTLWSVLMDSAQSNGCNAEHAAPAKGTLTKPASNFTATARFVGTENPRQLRAIAALLRRPTPRAQLDAIIGCANAPALVAELRREGLDVPCERIHFVDRDGRECRPGIYSFTLRDRVRLYRWMATRKANNG
jgi:hypothetical protein